LPEKEEEKKVYGGLFFTQQGQKTNLRPVHGRWGNKRKEISPPETAANCTNRAVERLEHKQHLAGLELQVQESQLILAESKIAVQQKVLDEKILETENGTGSKTMINRTVQMIQYDKRILSAKLDVQRAKIIKRRAQKTMRYLQLEKDIYEVNSGDHRSSTSSSGRTSSSTTSSSSTSSSSSQRPS
jgi:hypothetical protein